MKPIIEIRDLYKKYHYHRNIGATTMGEELRQLFKIDKRKKDTFFAIDNLNLDVSQGESLGIIGRNGAGKSTLLKILSKITVPTKGMVTIRGSVSSILEVGTGFHPELTGRENVFLNGAIFGLSRRELRSKFDEIVDFSGVEKFLDTPFKHYSTGMQVRLAFAIISHIESDIFISDEVLAVGDMAFQKKSLKKMQDIFKQGRTIIFVSHYQSMISALTKRCILLDNGKLIADGPTQDVIKKYFYTDKVSKSCFENEQPLRPMQYANLIKAGITDLDNNFIKNEIAVSEAYRIFMEFEILQQGNYNIEAVAQVKTPDGNLAFVANFGEFRNEHKNIGKKRVECTIPGNLLNAGQYAFTLSLITTYPFCMEHFIHENCLSCTIKDQDAGKRINYYGDYTGMVRPELQWNAYKL